MPTLPDWCQPLPDAERMRAVDRWAIEEQGVASLELMERAGEAVAQELERLAPDGPVAVLCGKGNNGGDGLVVARLLRERARPVSVLCACDPGELSGDARTNLQRLAGEPPLRFGEPAAAAALADAAAIVDALLGTGFQGEPHGTVAEAIEAIAAQAAPVVSVDVPSGVDASSGAVASVAVSARATVTFHAAKPGLWVAPGKRHSGRVLVADIGIPRGAPVDADVGLIGEGVLDCLPPRTAASTKFTSGHVVVAGGSWGLMGAPAMAALAAMRAGAGYVTACVPASQAPVLDGQLPEVMTRALSDDEGSLLAEDVEETLAALAKAGSLVLGPGLGRAPHAAAFARELARQAPVPTLIDADGLNAYAGCLAELSRRQAATVLTPHVGELGRLLETDSREVERERLRHARAAAATAGAVVVLKGDDTLIADPDGRTLVSRGESPALATAGTGDVLSGTIAALLAEGLEPLTAAAAGVSLHAAAGREAARRVGSAEGVIASDVIASLPAVRQTERLG
jgi:ADP-dependent NAD(P)H-hydrate dehydratase / NAD(P)H-hydrate epimerase